MANGDTKTEQMLNVLANGGDASQISGCCNTKTQDYILGAIDRIQSVEDEVDELKNNPDVVDIVDTYADLQAYDTQHLTNNDIIRVLQDETHSDNSTYYRFTKNPDTWTFIGEISGGGSSVNVVQTTGTSTTDVMSQDATTKMVFDDPATQANVKIGNGAAIGPNLTTNHQVSIGKNATIEGKGSNIAIGAYSSINNKANTRAIAIGGSVYKDNSIVIGGIVPNGASDNNVAIGFNSSSGGSLHTYSVALGNLAECTRSGEVNVGTGGSSVGFNSTKYRVLGGVHDGQLAQDAATVAQVNATIDAINAALSTNIPHIGAST